MIRISFVVFLTAVIWTSPIVAQTAFNFQGRLNDGSSPANGRYDLQFKLFDGITGGSQVGTTIDKPNLALINGVFSTQLDFGSAVFSSGNRFLEISIRPFNSPNAYVVLGARQQIMSVPLAVRAASATSSDTAGLAQNSLALNGFSSASFARLGVSNPDSLIADSLVSNSNLTIQGSTLQPATSYGLPKAMLAITGNGTIARCYNGVNGSATGNCGFSVANNDTGMNTITFPFYIGNRFWLTSLNEPPSGSIDVTATTISVFDGFSLRVRTFQAGSPAALSVHVFIF